MKVALVDSFPNRPRTAEREFIRRSMIALERLGWTGHCAVTSDDIAALAPDVVLATAEFTPKLTHHATLGAIWTPPAQFEDDPERIRAIRSYDGYFSGSPAMTGYLSDQLFAMANKRAPIRPFAPSCYATEFPADHSGFQALFYIGANWDGQRHGALLRRLERRLPLRVYGPRERWRGLSSGYAGELAFDGLSVLPTITRCGVALCLNRQEHSRMGLASARLFEAVAAGAIAITEPLPFVQQALGDTVFYVDSDLSETDKAEAIADIWGTILAAPRRAMDMARAAHEIFNRSLCLEALYRPLPDMLEEIGAAAGWRPASMGTSLPPVEYLVPGAGRSAAAIGDDLSMLAGQTWPALAVLVVHDDAAVGAAVLAEWQGRFQSLRLVIAPARPRSTALWQGLAELRAPFFAVLTAGARLHANHVASLMATLERHPDCCLAHAGAIAARDAGHYVRQPNFTGDTDRVIAERRSLAGLESVERLALLFGETSPAPHSWIARRERLTDDVLADPLLDHGEILWLQMMFARHGEFAASWRPTIEVATIDGVAGAIDAAAWDAVLRRMKTRLQHDSIQGLAYARVDRALTAERQLLLLLRSPWLRLGRLFGLLPPLPPPWGGAPPPFHQRLWRAVLARLPIGSRPT